MKTSTFNADQTMDSCTDCLSRRQFLATGSLGAVAVFLAACSSSDEGITEPDPAVPTLSGTTTIRLADYPALANIGGIARLNGTTAPVAIVRSATATYRAFSLRCPHAGGTVEVQGSGFRCPVHGATFNGSGAWTGGERTTALREYLVTLNATAGTLTINS